MRINHNISAQLANVNLKKVDRKLSSALEKLSSGYKITKAADDSAGLAISNKMRAQIRSLDQASRNSEDGQSIIQTAEGALSEVESILQRIRELAVQTANGTYTLEDRKAAQAEADTLMDEIDRIASTTEFNGKGLLDGSSQRVSIYSETGFSTIDMSSSVKQGTYKFTVDTAPSAASSSVTIAVPATGSTIYKINGESITIEATDTLEEALAKVSEVCDALGIDAQKDNGAADTLNLTTRILGEDQYISVQTPADTEPVIRRGEDAKITLGDGFADTATVRYMENGGVSVCDVSGFKMEFSIDSDANTAGEKELRVFDAGAMQIQIGANESQDISIEFPRVDCETLMLRNKEGDNIVNINYQDGAERSITVMDNAIRRVSEVRTDLGAYQNRLESTTASLDVSSENMTESMSRIIDTDMAAGMTEYTQQSVLSQAATSILAQANNRPQQILSLLQG